MARPSHRQSGAGDCFRIGPLQGLVFCTVAGVWMLETRRCSPESCLESCKRPASSESLD